MIDMALPFVCEVEVVPDTLFVNLNQLAKSPWHSICPLCLVLFLCFEIRNVSDESAGDRPKLDADRTTLVADSGQNLRRSFTSTDWTGPVPTGAITGLKNLGFNVVHLYVEAFDPSYPTNGSTVPSYSAANVDAIISETGINGLYLIITDGNAGNNADYTAA